MQKILGTLILCLLWCSTNLASEIKPFNKSGFIFNDGERVKYIKDYKITNPENTILVIYNHGLVAINQKWCNWPRNICKRCSSSRRGITLPPTII